MCNYKNSVIIFGGGQQGSLIARDLIENGHNVVIADIVQRNDDIPFIYVDVSKDSITEFLHPGIDLVVCALPAELGERCVSAAVFQGKDCVDLSFTECDLMKYDEIAKHNRCMVLADCGLAPGLPNLVIGHLVDKYERLDEAIFYVGGIAQNPKRNDLGYVPSWSIPDLCSEYTRPARILVNGKVITLPPPLYHTLHDLELLETPVGKLEAFYSDGVRSLLSLSKVVPTILEKTLRWPGHIEKIQKITGVSGDKYNIDALEAAYTALDRGTDDVVILRVRGKKDTIIDQYDLICYGNDEYTAMSRTTGHSCAAFAELVLQRYVRYGVLYPEDIGMLFPDALDLVISHLRNHDVYLYCPSFVLPKFCK